MRKDKGIVAQLDEAEMILRYESKMKFMGAPHSNVEESIRKNLMVIEHILRHKHDTVLDVGCGYGVLIRTLSSLLKEGIFVGGDLVRESIASNDILADGPEFMTIDLDKPLPFKNGSFDIVIAIEVIEHLSNLAGFFSEMGRILKKGGILVITAPYINALFFLIMRALPKSVVISLVGLQGRKSCFIPSIIKDEAFLAEPDAHKVDGFSKGDFIEFGRKNLFEMDQYKTFRFPVPEFLLNSLPRFLCDFIIKAADNFFPLGLECFVVYRKAK